MNSRIKEDVQKIFEFWCEVSKTENNEYGKNSNKRNLNTSPSGIIIESFPESYHDEQIITKIPDFAYPCEFENESVQSYSFVLTSDDSKWRFGFCRHDPKTQTAMIIITYLPWHDTFLRLLSVLGELRRNKNGEFESFLAEAYNKGVPELGGSLKLFYNSGQNHFIFQRPSQFQLPSIPENHNLNLYYNFVEPKNMISVFAAMLAERRIIFTSRRFDKLSSCIQAANAFLYPMVWQHIFIPVLPMKMKDILSAPMPYLIGVPEAVLQTMTPEELGDVVILNCDNGIFQSPFDDVKPMPSEIIQSMKKQLSNSNDHIGDRVSKIFLGVLVQLIGGYRDAVQFTQGQKITWDRDTFIESRPPNLRPFLTKMMELQIFQQFIEERLEMLNTGLGSSDEFELETLRYSEKIGRRGKHYKEFLRNVKEKTNPAVKSAVKSVKEGSRGVKTAYKDLKSKLRDITPPKSSSQFHSHISSFSTTTSISSTKIGSELHGNGIDYGGNNGTTATILTGHHRSAPSSPIFSKRSTLNHFENKMSSPSSSSISNSTTVIKKSSVGGIQTSNSQILNGFKNHYSTTTTTTNLFNYNNNNIGGGNSKSPTISPSSSLCSSDMNISQELQNHPLFKSPAVDRSLKPCNSLEYYGNNKTIQSGGNIGAKYGGQPVTLPTVTSINSNHNNNHHHHFNDHKSSSSSSSSSSLQVPSTTSHSTDNILFGNLSIINDDEGDDGNADDDLIRNNGKQQKTIKASQQHYSTTNSIYDTPPDMPSPPIPPKRTNSSNNAKKSILTNIDDKKQQQIQKQKHQNINGGLLSSSSSFETNFVDKKSGSEIILPPPSNKQNLNKTCVAPIPAPRNKSKEIPSTKVQEKSIIDDNTTKDLISLDDSNTSFELEDFDPLNQNAKPFPPLFGATQTQTILSSATTLATPATTTTISSTVRTRTTAGLIDGSNRNQQLNTNNSLSLPSTSSSSLSLSSSVHNPLYPYFSPQHRHTAPKLQQQQQQNNSKMNNVNINTKTQTPIANKITAKTNRDDDFELLRKYGLDQFTLTAAGTASPSSSSSGLGTYSDYGIRGISGSSSSSSGTKALNKSDWMVFD